MSKASIYFVVDNVDGKHEVKEIKHQLNTFRGVDSVSINEKTETIAVDYDTTGINDNQIEKKIKDLGYIIKEARLENRY